MQALDPVGHAPCGDAGDLGHLADRGTGAEVGLVRSDVRRRELVVPLKALGHLAHQAGGLQRPDPRGRPGTGQVERRREGRPVVEPGLGGNDVGVAARAPVGHGVDRSGWPTELGADHGNVTRVDGPGHWSGVGMEDGDGVMRVAGVGAFLGWSATSTVP